MHIFFLTGIFIIAFIVSLSIFSDPFYSVLIGILAMFLCAVVISTLENKNRKVYQCIEGNLYMVSDNLINQNKKCKIHEGEIYQIEENGDLIKIDFQR